MVFKLFSDVRYHELAPQLSQVKELNFDKADIWVNVDSKSLVLYTDNGKVDVSFSNYDELLDAIITVGRELVFRDIIGALDQAGYDLKYYNRLPRLGIDQNIIGHLLDEIEEAKEMLYNIKFKLLIKLGTLETGEVDRLIENNSGVKEALDDATEKYRELCWETYEDDDPDYCDRVIPVVDAFVYTIPEDKSVVTIIYVDQVGEVYKVEKRYDSAYDFLRALDEYSNKVIDP